MTVVTLLQLRTYKPDEAETICTDLGLVALIAPIGNATLSPPVIYTAKYVKYWQQ